MPHLSRSFYAAAVGTGAAYANFAVALPLYALASGRSSSFASGLLALGTICFALGALAASPLSARAGARNVLAAGLGTIACGHLVLLFVGAAPGLAAGAVVDGVGMGLFWVGSQTTLGRRSGADGSETGFVAHYALYVAGTVAGSIATGAAATAFRLAGLPHPLSIRLTLGLGLAASLGALTVWLPRRHAPGLAGRPEPLAAGLLLRGFAVQLPDLFLVAGLALVLFLTPVVLAKAFRFTPLEVGLVVAALAGAKIAGSLIAGRLARARGGQAAVTAMLAGASALASLLALADRVAAVFVVVLLATALLSTGVWPIMVDAAHARVEPEKRGGMAVAWNVREYAVIAAATAAGGFLLDVLGRPTLVFLLGAALLALSALAAALAMRRPVFAPKALLGESGP